MHPPSRREIGVSRFVGLRYDSAPQRYDRGPNGATTERIHAMPAPSDNSGPPLARTVAARPNWLRRFVLLALIVAVTGVTAWKQRHHFVRRNFREVAPGRIFAGGYQLPGPMAEIIADHGVKSVLSLRKEYPAGTKQHELEAAERAAVDGAGAAFHRLEVSFSESLPLAEQMDRVEAAADFLADPANQPVYVHCWAGQHRAGIVVAMYRLKYCGWTRAQAWAELEQYGGLTEFGPPLLLGALCAREDLQDVERIGARDDGRKQY